MKYSIKKFLCVTMVMALMLTICAGCGEGATNGDGLPSVVNIGTQSMPNLEAVAKTEKYFEQEMGVDVNIVTFDSGKDVNTALFSKSIDFGLIGSCPVTVALSQDMGLEVIWIHEVIGAIEALAVKSDIDTTQADWIKGKTIATPFASTAHFSLMKYIEIMGIDESEVTVLDMQTAEMFAAWERGEIDGAYVWEPTLSKLNDANIVVTNGDMAEKGYMTTNLEVVRSEFAQQYPEMVNAYIRALNKASNLYESDATTALEIIGENLNISYEEAKKQSQGGLWLTAEEQLSQTYFGTSEKVGAFAQNLYDTAVFLQEQGNITKLPDKTVFDNAVSPKYIEEVLKG